MINPKTKCKCGNLMCVVSKQCRKCADLARQGSGNPQWKGGRKISNGYVWVKCRQHPKASKGYVKEHVLVMEQTIGRYLNKGEEIHHLNGVKTDNRSENLVLCSSKKEHYNTYHKIKSKETKERMRLALINRWNNPEWKAKEIQRRNALNKPRNKGKFTKVKEEKNDRRLDDGKAGQNPPNRLCPDNPAGEIQRADKSVQSAIGEAKENNKLPGKDKGISGTDGQTGKKPEQPLAKWF